MKITDYLVRFPFAKQRRVKALLATKGVSGEDLDDVMYSRLCDLDVHISWEEMQELIKED